MNFAVPVFSAILNAMASRTEFVDSRAILADSHVQNFRQWNPLSSALLQESENLFALVEVPLHDSIRGTTLDSLPLNRHSAIGGRQRSGTLSLHFILRFVRRNFSVRSAGTGRNPGGAPAS